MRGERAERKMKRFKERDRQTGRRQRRQNRRAEQRRVYLNDGADIWNQTSGIKISGMQLPKKNLVVTPCILLVGVKISQAI